MRGLAADQPLLSLELPRFFRNTAWVRIPEEMGATGRRPRADGPSDRPTVDAPMTNRPRKVPLAYRRCRWRAQSA